ADVVGRAARGAVGARAGGRPGGCVAGVAARGRPRPGVVRRPVGRRGRAVVARRAVGAVAGTARDGRRAADRLQARDWRVGRAQAPGVGGDATRGGGNSAGLSRQVLGPFVWGMGHVGTFGFLVAVYLMEATPVWWLAVIVVVAGVAIGLVAAAAQLRGLQPGT